MSYEIIYNKQFIKVNEKEFVPMILAGSNNCTEWANGRERRSRSWFPHTHMLTGKLYGTLAEILETAEQINKDKTDEYSFFSHIALKIGNKSTYNDFLNFFKNACKRAKTVEELTTLGINVYVMNGYINSDSNIVRKDISVSTTEHLIKAINELTEFYKGTNVNVTVTYGCDTDYVNRRLKTNTLVNVANRSKNRYEKEKLLNEAKELFYIEMPNNRYFVKATKYGYKYLNYTCSMCKRFLTEKEGNAYLKKSHNIVGKIVKINNHILD